ncbi:uncharacterized protein L3040_007385 [Drepanopeziza brunnea f. sp. 'multigermtubi']|uniref:uncharacterized protein n=1 Tax=Drepanopeziza brunnea f. sp. 'multigermtubi' TaxID=698441 RepID=UPI002386C00D|nr:hypothetical protein L3040_007385 [Drepanopeziza brunnea f. sp. 'multigermtubi']
MSQALKLGQSPRSLVQGLHKSHLKSFKVFISLFSQDSIIIEAPSGILTFFPGYKVVAEEDDSKMFSVNFDLLFDTRGWQIKLLLAPFFLGSFIILVGDLRALIALARKPKSPPTPTEEKTTPLPKDESISTGSVSKPAAAEGR